MKRRQKLLLHVVVTAMAIFGMSGCSAVMEGVQSQMEVPTLENQVNRVAVGMAIVRENNIMAYKMPISSDASWPELVASDINDTEEQFIVDSLMDDPYFATVHYTEMIQRQILGSSAAMKNVLGGFSNITAMVLNQTVKPLTKRAMQKIVILYGKDTKKWPNVFDFDGKLNDFLEFKDGTLKDIEASKGDVYETIGEAVISLTPTSLQKDLSQARVTLLEGYDKVASLNGQKGELEAKLKNDEAKSKSKAKEDVGYVALSKKQRKNIEREVKVVEERIKEAESFADEKEDIYFELLDQAVVALESEMNIDDENYVKLAKNINTVSDEIQTGAYEAYTSFGLALSNIVSSDIILKFPKELVSLGLGKIAVPANLQSKYNERVKRVVKNALYLLPNIFMGTYYANKQSNLAQKYENITSTIIDAYNVKKEQEAAALKAAQEAAKKAAEKKAS